MLVKIIFSDFDETLIDYYSESDFSSYGMDVLSRVKDMGVIFVIVTGRPINFFGRIDKLVGYIDYIIASNGAEIFDVKREKVIYFDSINSDRCRDIIDYCRGNDIKFYVNCGLNRYCHKDSIDNYDNISQIIIIFKDRFWFEKMKSYLVNFDDIKISNIVYNDTRCSIDINNITVSKGNSIKYLCDILGISKDDTIGFGDSDNDISMFEVVGKSVCVGNATDVIKQLVDDVCDDCHNDGVFKYLDDVILK